MGLHRLGKDKDFEEDKIYSFDFENKHIIVVKKKGKYYALEGICTHEYADLGYGILTEDVIVCPLHLSQFDIYTGKVLNPPAERDLKKYNVKVIEEEVFVEL